MKLTNSERAMLIHALRMTADTCRQSARDIAETDRIGIEHALHNTAEQAEALIARLTTDAQ